MNEGKILRFTASWCHPCKQLMKELDKVVIPVPVEVVDIDIDRYVADDHNVRGVPTLMFIKNSYEIGRLTGVQSKEAIEDWISHCMGKA